MQYGPMYTLDTGIHTDTKIDTHTHTHTQIHLHLNTHRV